MSEIHIRRTHHLTPQQAREGAQRIAEELRQRHQLESVWEGEQLAFTRSGLKGTLNLEPGAVEIHLELGFLLAMFRQSLEAEIHRFFDERFGPA